MDPSGDSCARVVEGLEKKGFSGNTFTMSGFVGLVREVGFEPTNPYGTGASGLRFHDP